MKHTLCLHNLSLSRIVSSKEFFHKKRLMINQTINTKLFEQGKVCGYRKKNESFKIINLIFAFVGIGVAVFLVAVHQNVGNQTLVGLSLFFVLLCELLIIVS